MQKLLTILTLTAGCLFANYDDDCCNPCDPCDPCDPCEVECCEPCDFMPPCPPDTCAYNAPVMIDIKCSWDMFLSASFLYMQAKEDNLPFAQSNQFDDLIFTEAVGTLSYDYEPAFRVGLGFNIGCDDWMFNFEYTRYHADVASGSFSKENSAGILPYLGTLDIWFLAQEEVTNYTNYTASSKWRLEMDLIDFNLSRKYFVGHCLTFNSHFGIRAGWIDQTYTANYVINSPSKSESINSTSNTESWAVGLRGGLDTDWRFCGGFYLFGNGAISILYTDYDKVNIQYNATLANFQDSASTSLCFLRPQTDLAIGLGWSDYFCCNDWFFDFRIGYEMQVFWNQNVLLFGRGQFTEKATLTSYHPAGGDLYLHGLVIAARLDF